MELNPLYSKEQDNDIEQDDNETVSSSTDTSDNDSIEGSDDSAVADETDDDESDNDDDDDEMDFENEPLEDEQPPITNKVNTLENIQLTNIQKEDDLMEGEEEDEDDDEDENYLQKFDSEITKNYLTEFHPECFSHNYDEISKLSTVIRNSDNIIIDPLHKTIPFLTKYEKARILGQRAKQIETGSKTFVKIPESIIDSYIIAELELREKKIPFIIKRPIPSGAFEYLHLKDLDVIGF
jgi:DNA-directed RNA polymerase I, II, and III subunit RPABC2